MKTLLASFLLALVGTAGNLHAAQIPRVEVPATAYAEGSVEDEDPRVEVRLIADHTHLQPGDSARIGLLFHLDPDWHVYWRNSGDSGMATDLELRPEAWHPGPIQWPAPSVFVDPSGQVATFGYSDAELLWVDVQAPSDFQAPQELTVEVSWLACKIDCIPGDATLSLILEPGKTTTSAQFELFEKATARLPADASKANTPPSLRLDVPEVRRSSTFGAELSIYADVVPAAARRFDFIPDETPGISWTTEAVLPGHPTVLKLKGEATAGKMPNSCGLSGVVWSKTGPLQIALPVPCKDAEALPEATPSKPLRTPEPPGQNTPLAYVLMFAFLGGLLLNLMPCVFPVLALKSFGLVKNAHAGRKAALINATAYAVGVVVSMLVLAGVVVGLKAAGTQVGWGFQFQEPWFVVGLSALLTVFAANLFGAFELSFSVSGTRSSAHGIAGSALEGALAVVLATPCSAPMLGTAVGFALSSSAPIIFATFGLVGAGLAAPFVVLSAFPQWATRLPKPGPWMVTFKKFLGFSLYGAVVWLLWVLGQSLGADALTRVLAFLLALSLGVWAFGQYQYASLKARILSATAALCITLAGAYLLPDLQPTTQAATRHDDGWQPWSPEGVATERAAGKTVFVDFTADWCITCKVNENGALVAPEVEAAFAKAGVVKFKADWTRRDETIRQELEKYGKAGVPLYLMFRPGEDTARVLPEILTPAILVQAVER